jgi:type I restriction enzyme, S subunit
MSYKEVTLENLTDNITDGTHSTVKNDKNGDCFLLSAKNIKNGHIIYDLSDRKINRNTLIELRRRTKLETNDVLITTVGTIGEVAQINDLKPKYEFQRSVAILKPNTKIVDPKYLMYLIANNEFKQKAIRHSSGSVQKCLFLNIIKNIRVIINDNIEHQKAIANILSSLDDKIELNNKINKNLEEMAQTLYKRWFVDFEFPNENGEPYKSSGGEMVESELGLIPKGWEVVNLISLVEKNTVKINPDSQKKLIDMANMPSYSISLNSFDSGDKLSTNTYEMKKLSFLYGSIRPYLGKFGIAPFEGITTGTIHNYRVKNELDYSFVASLSFSTIFNEFCIKLSHGTKMPTIKWDDFASFKFAFNNKTSQSFNSICFDFYRLIVNNVLSNIQLTKIRDELLPKLMSGEIEVPLKENLYGN